MLTWHRDFFAQLILLRCLPLLNTWITPGLGLPHEPLPSTSGPEQVGCYPPRTFPKVQRRRGMAQWVQKLAQLHPSYHLEILGGVEAEASYHRHKFL